VARRWAVFEGSSTGNISYESKFYGLCSLGLSVVTRRCCRGTSRLDLDSDDPTKVLHRPDQKVL
jgi:hypothetical protein